MCCWGGLGNQDELKLNGTHNLLVHAEDINLMCEHINTMQRNTESLPGTSRDVGLVVNQRNPKYRSYVHISSLNWRTRAQYKESLQVFLKF
jgi:hypothetical protein